MKVLIIEDEHSLLDAIEKYLSTEGYLCETAADFITASDKINRYDYDCIVVDITIPNGSGLHCQVSLINFKNYFSTSTSKHFYIITLYNK